MPRYDPTKGGLPADVVSYEMVVIPVYTGPLKGGHWAMAILIPASGRLLFAVKNGFHDRPLITFSLVSTTPLILIASVTGPFFKTQSGEKIDHTIWCICFDGFISEWREIMMRKRDRTAPAVFIDVIHGPQQDNEYNCGVHILKWATKMVRREKNPDVFSQVCQHFKLSFHHAHP